MTATLHASPLRPDQFDKAFALIQLAFPGISLERWQRQVETSHDHSNEGPGWIAAFDDKGYIHGLLAYRIEPDVLCRRNLVGHDIILASIVVDRTASCLIAGISQMAWRNRYDAVHVLLPWIGEGDLDSSLASVRDRLLEFGFIDRGIHYCYRLRGNGQKSGPI
jgi:hypothetical protein